MQYFLPNQIELCLTNNIFAIVFFFFSFFKIFKDPVETFDRTENCVSHALMLKNETQHNLIEHGDDIWTYSHSTLYHILNLLSYWYYKVELLCYRVLCY